MKPFLLTLAIGPLLLLSRPALAGGPEDSVVKVIASVRVPNPLRPWTKGTDLDVAGSGVVIEGKKIITCAHVVAYASEVHVQAKPGGEKISAKVEVAATDVDLAVLTVSDDAFFKTTPPLARSTKLPQAQDAVAVYGYPIGGRDLAVTKGVVSRLEFGLVDGGNMATFLQISAALNPGNSGGPAVVNGSMVGVAVCRLNGAENIGYVLSNEEIDLFLKDSRGGRYEGKLLDTSGTGYRRLENDAMRRMLQIDSKTKGLLVSPPDVPPADYPLRALDVLTRIGTYDLDNEGMVQIDGGRRVFFFYLIPKLVRDGRIPATVLRSGQPVNISLPVTRHDPRLIREFQGEPLSYFIHGPLVFAPLRSECIPYYSQLNPFMSITNSPLVSRRLDRVRFPGEELVVVTAPMFAHKISKGYDNPVGQVVKDVNGVQIKNLRHLVETFRDRTDPYLKIRFADDPSTMVVFERNAIEKATDEILEDNGIAPTRRGSPDMLKAWKK